MAKLTLESFENIIDNEFVPQYQAIGDGKGRWIYGTLKKQVNGNGEPGKQYFLFRYNDLQGGKVVVDAPNPPFDTGNGNG